MNPTLETIHAHRSIRKYTDNPVTHEHILQAMRAGQMAATSSAVQPYCVIQITDEDIRKQIAELAGPQPKVHECPTFFVICADLRKHMLIVERTGEEYSASLEAFLVGTIDASLFAQNFNLAFESMGYGACYIGGIRNDLPLLDKLLRLPRGVCPLYGLCVGVPDESPSTRPRLDAEAMLFENCYPSDEETLESIDRYDELYKKYLADRGAQPNTWSASIAKKFSYARREGLSDFFRSKGASLD